jgi:putative ABC transport system permease protein
VTATFTATYHAQAEVDAQLTNGAYVTVSPSPGTQVPPAEAARIAAVPGVRAVEPMQHRYAHAGADLQDLYGVRPGTITDVTVPFHYAGVVTELPTAPQRQLGW